MGRAELCVNIALEAKEDVPEHISNAANSKPEDAQQREFITGRNGLLPAITPCVIDDEHTAHHHGNDKQS